MKNRTANKLAGVIGGFGKVKNAKLGPINSSQAGAKSSLISVGKVDGAFNQESDISQVAPKKTQVKSESQTKSLLLKEIIKQAKDLRKQNNIAGNSSSMAQRLYKILLQKYNINQINPQYIQVGYQKRENNKRGEWYIRYGNGVKKVKIESARGTNNPAFKEIHKQAKDLCKQQNNMGGNPYKEAQHLYTKLLQKYNINQINPQYIQVGYQKRENNKRGKWYIRYGNGVKKVKKQEITQSVGDFVVHNPKNKIQININQGFVQGTEKVIPENDKQNQGNANLLHTDGFNRLLEINQNLPDKLLYEAEDSKPSSHGADVSSSINNRSINTQSPSNAAVLSDDSGDSITYSLDHSISKKELSDVLSDGVLYASDDSMNAGNDEEVNHTSSDESHQAGAHDLLPTLTLPLNTAKEVSVPDTQKGCESNLSDSAVKSVDVKDNKQSPSDQEQLANLPKKILWDTEVDGVLYYVSNSK